MAPWDLNTHLNEAVVQREVVSDGVPPSGTPRPEVCVVVEDPLVDVAEHELLVLGAEDRHGDESDVRVVRLRLFVQKTRAGVVLALQVEKTEISSAVQVNNRPTDDVLISTTQR